MGKSLKRIRKAVIPAAGYGTRLLPITKVVPKELLPIGNKPAIQYVVEEAVAAGVEEIILVCHPSKMEIVDYFKPNKDLRSFLESKGKREEIDELERVESMARFEVVYQEEPLGLGHAVLCAREAVGDEPFLVMLPDVLIPANNRATNDLVKACPDPSDWGLLLERIPQSQISSYGIVRAEAMGPLRHRLRGAVEKPGPDEAPSDLGILGRYLLTSEIFADLRSLKAGKRGEIQLTDAIDALAQRSPGTGLLNEGRFFDIGTPEGLVEAYQSMEFGEDSSFKVRMRRSI